MSNAERVGEGSSNAMELMDTVRRLVQSYQWDSGEEFQEATSIANEIISIVRRNDELLERGR